VAGFDRQQKRSSETGEGGARLDEGRERLLTVVGRPNGDRATDRGRRGFGVGTGQTGEESARKGEEETEEGLCLGSREKERKEVEGLKELFAKIEGL